MVDVRKKGARGEKQVIEILKKYYNYNFQRTPGSGALGPDKGLKGDIYIPQVTNRYTIEVKNYKDDELNTGIIKNKSNKVREWWKQTCRQAKQNKNEPILIYKYNRSKWFIVMEEPRLLLGDYNLIGVRINDEWIFVALLEEVLADGKLEFI